MTKKQRMELGNLRPRILRRSGNPILGNPILGNPVPGNPVPGNPVPRKQGNRKGSLLNPRRAAW